MFGAFGAVQECRILHRGDDFRGAGALVRMNNIEAASHAIATLNGHTPRGVSGESLTSMPLVVRYADTPEEKARKQARKEQLATRLHRSDTALQRLICSLHLGKPASVLDLRQRVCAGHWTFRHCHRRTRLQLLCGTAPSLLASRLLALQVAALCQLQRAQSSGDIISRAWTLIAGLVELGANLPSSAGLFVDSLQADTALDAMLSGLGPGTPHHSSETLSLPSSSLGALGYSPSQGLIQPPPPPPPPGGCASLYVKNLPPETDKLWLYERSGSLASWMTLGVW